MNDVIKLGSLTPGIMCLLDRHAECTWRRCSCTHHDRQDEGRKELFGAIDRYMLIGDRVSDVLRENKLDTDAVYHGFEALSHAYNKTPANIAGALLDAAGLGDCALEEIDKWSIAVLYAIAIGFTIKVH